MTSRGQQPHQQFTTRHAACRLTLVVVTATLVPVSGPVTMVAGSLVAHGITLS
jgi:hypothetical protein